MVTYTLPSPRPRTPSSKWQLPGAPRGGKAVERMLALEKRAAMASVPRSRLTPQIAAVAAAVAGLGIMAWQLHAARTEVTRLESRVDNLTTLARAAVSDHIRTKKRLINANEDKLMMGRFLHAAGQAEKELKHDLGDLETRHREVVLSSEQQAQEWAAEGAALKQSLETETAQREEAQQLALGHEAESQRLAGVTAELERGVMQLRHENQLMFHEIGRQRCYIGSLEGENSSLKSANSKLESEVSSLNSTVSTLQSQVCNHHCHHDHCHR